MMSMNMVLTLFRMLLLQWKMVKDLAHGTTRAVLNSDFGKPSLIDILFDHLSSIWTFTEDIAMTHLETINGQKLQEKILNMEDSTNKALTC